MRKGGPWREEILQTTRRPRRASRMSLPSSSHTYLAPATVCTAVPEWTGPYDARVDTIACPPAAREPPRPRAPESENSDDSPPWHPSAKALGRRESAGLPSRPECRRTETDSRTKTSASATSLKSLADHLNDFLWMR